MRTASEFGADVQDWGSFAGAPARETGAFQNGFGAVGRDAVSVQKSAKQQKVDTETLRRMQSTLLNSAAGYAGLQLRLAPLQAELAVAWSAMSVHARSAEDLLGGIQADLLDLNVSIAEYAAKLETARLSYEHAEQLAAALVSGFDALHSTAFRLMGTTSTLPVGVVLEAAVFVGDSKLRGTGAATASAMRGSGLPLENWRRQLVVSKRAERAAGIGLVRLKDFHEVESRSGELDRDGSLDYVADRLNEAGGRDNDWDAKQGLDADDVETGHVDVTVVTRPDGTRSYLVSVPGTDFDNLDATHDPNSLATIFDVASTTSGTPLRKSPAMMQAVDRALQEAGADGDSDVVLSGFSQGGMQAMALAANTEFAKKYRIKAVATTGTPTEAYTGVDPSTKIVHLRDVNDLVPRSTGGGTDPGNDQAIVVHSDTGDDGVVAMTHDGGKYRGAARLADTELQKTAEGREYLQTLKAVMPAGSTVVTRTYETKQEAWNPVPEKVVKKGEALAASLLVSARTLPPPPVPTTVPRTVPEPARRPVPVPSTRR